MGSRKAPQVLGLGYQPRPKWKGQSKIKQTERRGLRKRSVSADRPYGKTITLEINGTSMLPEYEGRHVHLVEMFERQ
jgi:hypothetical protein